MKSRLISVAALTLFAAVPTALASATWYVDGVKGNDSNDCKSATTACKTIGHAISLSSSSDSIMVAAATYIENLFVGFGLKIVGAGAATTIVDGGGVGRVVTIPKNTLVTLSKMTIRNGLGGISNSGTLTINNATVSRNRVTGVFGAYGGGIYNAGTLTINNSTLSGNNAIKSGKAAFGGGIYNAGTLTMNNSTVSTNSAGACSIYSKGFGGGIANAGTLMISNSTLSGNAAQQFGLQGCADGYGGAIYNQSGSSVKLQNSIVAYSQMGGDCYGTMTSNGYNLSSDNTCTFNNTGDLNNTNPVLGPLQSNGGQTQTMALHPGSPAIDAGNPSGCTDGQGRLLKTDQRGMPRPDK